MSTSKTRDFTEGKILQPLLLFALPVLLALFLQAMYGAVDLMVVGKFGDAADISGVSTGSQIMQTITNVLASFAMGTTIQLGQLIGQKREKECGRVIGASVVLFGFIALVLTILLVLFAPQAARIMQAPEEAFDNTVTYVRICGAGTLILTFYNLISCIFRGLGDSNTPLVTVAIACVFNIFGDLLLVGGFHLGCAGAAIATVAAQLLSDIISLALIRKKQLPFRMTRKDLRWDGAIIRGVVSLGLPIALQDLLVGISFLIILSIVNSLGGPWRPLSPRTTGQESTGGRSAPLASGSRSPSPSASSCSWSPSSMVICSPGSSPTIRRSSPPPGNT